MELRECPGCGVKQQSTDFCSRSCYSAYWRRKEYRVQKAIEFAKYENHDL